VRYLCVDITYEVMGFSVNAGEIAVLLGLSDFLIIIFYLFMIVSL